MSRLLHRVKTVSAKFFVKVGKWSDMRTVFCRIIVIQLELWDNVPMVLEHFNIPKGGLFCVL